MNILIASSWRTLFSEIVNIIFSVTILFYCIVCFLQSQSAAGFEEGDDSIVPSTPTLFVPRRTDGFAEAVG